MSLPWAEFLTIWVFLGVNILSPGPNVINTIATAMGGGRPAGLASAAGVGLGIGMWCLGMSLGVAAMFAVVPAMQQVLTVVAMGLLVWFATRYLRAAWAGWRGIRHGLPPALPPEGAARAFARSLVINALNPKALTTWLAILAIFPISRATAGDLAVLCAGACAMSFTIHTGYAMIFSTAPAARFYLRWGWAISGAAGLFFATFAVKLAADLLAGA